MDPIRTVAADARGATFEYAPGSVRFDSLEVEGRVYARVSLADAVVSDEPGRPALPVATIPFAVPSGMSPRLRVLSEEWVERPGPPPIPVPRERIVSDHPLRGPETEIRYVPDPAVYGSGLPYPAAAVSLGTGFAVGSLWMVPAQVRPIRFDPRAGAYRLLRHMTLRVDFIPASERERAARPAARPGQDSEPWRRVQSSLIRNYDAARTFPARLAPSPARLPRRAGAAGLPEFRILATAAGMRSVSQAALAAAGFPAGVSIATIGLWERGYSEAGDSATATPIPIVARDGNGNGVFEAGDAITFYARSLADRFGQDGEETRAADANVYWITWGGASGARFDSIPGVISDPSPATPASFPETIHLEQDLRLLSAPARNVGSPPENVESIFWTSGEEPDQFEATIPFVDPDPAGTLALKARYQGENSITHRLDVFFQNAAGANDTLALQQTFTNQEVYILDTGPTIPASHIVLPGANRFRHVGEHQVGGVGSFTPGSFAWLDWIEATYSRLFIARGNILSFGSGATGAVTEIRVTGFTQPGIEVYDVTAPAAPLRVTGVIESNPGLGAYEIVFRTDASAGERRFVALVPGSEIAIGGPAILADVTSDLGTPAAFPPGSIARSILIAPAAFLTPATRLADYRRTQGYVVELARAEDVYDEFGGGIASPMAIRRYLRHAFLTWTPAPTFVALAGDASIDPLHRISRSGGSWLPTYLKFETISGPLGSELVAHDSFYAIDLGDARPSDSSVAPSVFLGRIPASSAAELDQYVTKVIQYEIFQPTDSWRGRQLLVSDDDYSTTIFFNVGYCQQPAEVQFRIASQDMGDVEQSSASGPDLETEFFDIKTYSDPIPTFPSGGMTCKNLLEVVNAFRMTGGAVDQLHTRIAQGNLIVNFEAHANRYLISHEQIYETLPGSTADRDRLANFGRPAFFMVWGCHANQFPDGPFQHGFVDSTDAIGEQWLLLPNTGSIASFGSSGYELLNTNATYNGLVARAFYAAPPPIPVPGQPNRARWILGEVIGLAALRNAALPSFLQQIMNLTLHLGGDPMLRMDALPPRIFEVTIDGAPVQDGDALVSASPVDSLTLVAKVRDETALKRTELAERPAGGGTITPLDSTLYAVAVADTARSNTLTARVRPRNANYDLLVRTIDSNDRERLFALQVRVAVRYLANGTQILNGVFVAGDAVLRAEVTTPIPVTADSLELMLDGSVIFSNKTPLDGSGRRWALESLPEQRGPGAHVLGFSVGGRPSGDTVTFSVDTGFTLRGVVVVSPRAQGAGCDGSVFQYELSSPARSVRLLVMTISGRRVASMEWPGVTGYNVRCWDGRDSQGHETATGVYLYRLTATDVSGRAVSRSGRMIRSR